MKPTWKTRVAALSPKNNYKFAPYCVEIFKHQGRDMKPAETDFISCVQRTDLPGLALLLLVHQDNAAKLELFRIAMQFHTYRNDLEQYLVKNKGEPKIQKALEVWKSIKSGQATFRA